MGGMGRWEPDARGRLAKAALALFGEQGFEQTTVAEIAERAGLTERTFFRHYTDKREVLFAGSSELQDLLVTTVAAAPSELTPLDAVGLGLDAVADLLQSRREFAVVRQAVITSHAELRSRELMKLAVLSDALAATLRARGVGEPAASLVAETGIGVFKVAFERWVSDSSDPSLRTVMRQSLDELRAVTAAVP
jgi:AcrR family transcriptional regulator